MFTTTFHQIAKANREARRKGEVKRFADGILDAIAFTEEEELGDGGHSFARATAQLAHDVADAFIARMEELGLDEDLNIGNAMQYGIDFWMTVKGYGVGFWDGDYTEHGDALTALTTEAQFTRWAHCEVLVADGYIYLDGLGWN